MYKVCCEQVNSRVLVYTTFCSYWRQLLPQIVVTKPRTDLRWRCQQNSTLIVKATNKSAEEKSKVQIMLAMFNYVTFMHFKAINSAEEHIGLVQKERAHYRECLDVSSSNLKESFPVVPPPGSCLPANSTDTAIHYSFDMAQQVCIHTPAATTRGRRGLILNHIGGTQKYTFLVQRSHQLILL